MFKNKIINVDGVYYGVQDDNDESYLVFEDQQKIIDDCEKKYDYYWPNIPSSEKINAFKLIKYSENETSEFYQIEDIPINIEINKLTSFVISSKKSFY